MESLIEKEYSPFDFSFLTSLKACLWNYPLPLQLQRSALQSVMTAFP